MEGDAVIELGQELVLRAEIGGQHQVGNGPYGARLVVDVVGGRVEGERLQAEILGGGDWVLVGADGFGRLDVRLQLRTDDGALVYCQYQGLLEMNEAVGAALATGGSTQFGDQYFRTALRMESGDERYAWLNRTLFVGKGRLTDGQIEYVVYAVE